jgi:glycosyltransferase domain-containing protein
MTNSTSDLTLLLAQFGRQSFSERFLSYLSSTSCPYPIVYADGDADGFARDMAHKFQNDLDITLVEFKQTEKFKHYFTMMVRGLKEVKTPYVMLCDNDDFIIYSSINKLMSFLNSKPEYISAGSPIQQVHIDNYSTKAYGQSTLLGKRYSHHRDQEPLSSYEDQARETFLNFQPNFYNIFKTEVLLQIWEEILELDFTDLTIMEFYYQLRASTLGKQFADKSITHYVRQSGVGTWENKVYDFSLNLVYNDLPSDIRKVADRIALICVNEFSSDYQSIYKVILDSYAMHLNLYLPHNVMRYRFPKLFQIQLNMMKMLKKNPIFFKTYYLFIDFAFKRQLKCSMKDSYMEFEQELIEIKKVTHNSHS